MSTTQARIKELREAMRLSRTEFGERIGERSSKIQDLERGKQRVQDYILSAIVTTFNANPEWLLIGTGPMFRSGAGPTRTTEPLCKVAETGPAATAERLAAIRRTQLRVNAGRMASRLDISDDEYQAYESGAKTLSSDLLLQLYQAFDINPLWLITGQGEPFFGKEERQAHHDCLWVRVFDERLRTGRMRLQHGETERHVPLSRKWLHDAGIGTNLYAIIAREDAMKPSLVEGDIAFVDHTRTAIVDGGIFGVLINDTPCIRRLHVSDEQALLVYADDPNYRAYTVQEEFLVIIGRVVAYTRRR